MLDQEKNFYLKGNQGFNSRQKSIFHALDKLSAEQPENRFKSDQLKVPSVSVVKDRKELKQFVGQESIFKRPDVNLKKCMKLRIPEFIKNPHKWKRYSLGDDEISDHSNRIVAMSFLKILNERLTKPEEKTNDNKPRFNKCVKDSGMQLATVIESEKPTFINGKTIMPEYVVGQKIKRKTKKKEHPASSNDSVKLEHLFNEE